MWLASALPLVNCKSFEEPGRVDQCDKKEIGGRRRRSGFGRAPDPACMVLANPTETKLKHYFVQIIFIE